jgi:hypothetical protein
VHIRITGIRHRIRARGAVLFGIQIPAEGRISFVWEGVFRMDWHGLIVILVHVASLLG